MNIDKYWNYDQKKKYTHNFIKKMKIDRFDNKELEYVYFLHLLICLFTFFSLSQSLFSVGVQSQVQDQVQIRVLVRVWRI